MRFRSGEQRDVQRAAGRLFGRPLRRWEYAGLAGAPDDARVELSTCENELFLEMGDPISNCYRAYLYVRRHGAALVVVKAGFQILYRRMQGRGLGLRIFHRQLQNSTALGVARIEAVAGRREDENGYYTWPRFGFDGPLPRKLKGNLPPGLDHANTVLDLMECERGRLWWRRHGCTIAVVFDLATCSRSRGVFRQYVGQKLERVGAGVLAL